MVRSGWEGQRDLWDAVVVSRRLSLRSVDLCGEIAGNASRYERGDQLNPSYLRCTLLIYALLEIFTYVPSRRL